MEPKKTDEKPATPATEKDARQQLEEAIVRDEKGAVRGVRVQNPRGDIVLDSRGEIRLAASVERGVYIEGLKDGWKLASAKDEADRKAANEKAKAARAAAEK